MQKYPDVIYKWAEENLNEINEEQFYQISHITNSSISMTTYKGPTGKVVESKTNINDPKGIINEKI